MRPVDFPASNKTLTEPAAWHTQSRGRCENLPVWNDGEESISCWRLGWRERLKVLFTGRVWLRVVGGLTQPPVSLLVDKPGWTLETPVHPLPTQEKA